MSAKADDLDLGALQHPTLLPALFFVAAYLACAELGKLLTLAPDMGAFLWPPSGLLLAVFSRSAKERNIMWLALAAITDFIASTVLFGYPIWLAVLIAIGNCLEAKTGAMLLRRWANGPFKLTDVRSSLALVLISAVGTPLLSAVIGGTAVAARESQPLFTSWWLWWSGDALGVLLIAPIALSTDHPRVLWTELQRAVRLKEVIALFLLLIACAQTVLFYQYPIAFIVLPLMTWAALRHGFAISSIAVGVTVVVAVTNAEHGHGPFMGPWSVAASQFLLQIFAIVMALAGLCTAGLSAQVTAARDRAEDAYERAKLTVLERTALLQGREVELENAVTALRQADERKNAFLYTLTHELRGPLGTFGNCLTLLEQFPKLDAIRSVMGRQFSQLTYLVNDMSDLAAISLGKMTMRFVDIDLKTVVQNAAETVEPAMRKREQVFEVHLPNDEVTVVGDSMRLVQSVKNLLSNASRYTQRGGTIKVELMASRAHATISVTDNGQGISANALPYIFNMYEQVAGVDKGGLGIGLALVKRISEMHGGSVSLTSVEGRGSTFVLTLPLKKETIGTAA